MQYSFILGMEVISSWIFGKIWISDGDQVLMDVLVLVWNILLMKVIAKFSDDGIFNYG